MNKIFLKSDKFSHIAGVTIHATNRLARKSLCNLQLLQSATLATGPKTGSSNRAISPVNLTECPVNDWVSGIQKGNPFS